MAFPDGATRRGAACFIRKICLSDSELHYASRVLPTIEINGSFYSLQYPASYQSWHDETPEDFVFAVKGPRFITHMKKLRDVETPLANFFASGVFNLRRKLGPILWQFPPNFKYDRQKLTTFFELLPHDTEAALKLARRRDARMYGRAKLRSTRVARYDTQWKSATRASAIRRSSKLLREHNIALVIAETAQRFPMMHDITADFVYMRLHGDQTLYQSGYSDRALEKWAKRIEAWHRGGELRSTQKDHPSANRQRRSRVTFIVTSTTPT